jgi:hypothetical protein
MVGFCSKSWSRHQFRYLSGISVYNIEITFSL